MSDVVRVNLIIDLNNNGEIDSNEELRSDSAGGFSGDGSISVTLGAAEYFIRVYAPSISDNTGYILDLSATNTPPTPPTDPGSTLETAFDLGFVSGTQSIDEFVGTVDRNDYYRFRLSEDANFGLVLSDLSDNARVELIIDLNDNGEIDSGEVLRSDSAGGFSGSGFISVTLGAAEYFIRVYAPSISDNTGYTLSVSSTADPVNNPPVAVNDNTTTLESTAVTIDVLANDNAPDNDPIQLTGFTTATNGTVSRDENGTSNDQTDDQLIYTPDPGFTGNDIITYTISDANGITDTATVNITVNPAPEDALQLRVTPSEPTKAAVPNTSVSFDVNYSTDPAETPTSGMVFRMHWDSSQVAFDPVTGLTNRFSFGAQSTGVIEDDPVTNGGLDGDPNTDKYILQAWIDASGNWPNNSNPTLYTANFTALPGFEGTRINFSANPDNLPANSTFVPSSIALTPRRFTLDIDGNGVVDGLTDGILALRYLIEFRGETLTNNALGEGATRDAAEIVTYLDEARDIMLDVDGNGTAGGLSDGILFLRYALGLTGDALISRAIEEGATRTTETAIIDHLQSFDLL